MKQPYVSTLIEQDFTSAEKALGRHNIDAISSADLEGYATQEWVQDQNYITSADLPDVSDMATKTWTSENFYPDTNPSGFITSSDVTRYREGDYISIDPITLAISVTGINPDDYVTQEDLESATSGKMDSTEASAFYPRYDNPEGYITSADLPDLTDYVTSADVSGFVDVNYVENNFYSATNPSGFVTSADLPDLSDYATKQYVDENFYSASNPSGFITSADIPPVQEYSAGQYVSITDHVVTVTGLQPEGDYLTSDDLSGYATKSYVDENFYSASNPSGFITSADLPDLSDYATIQYVDNSVYSATSGKQDKLEFGYTDNKISSINSSAIYGTGGSFTQEQADWTENDNTQVDYIKNKPTPVGLKAGYGIRLTDETSAVKIESNLWAPTVECHAMSVSDAGYVNVIYPQSSACVELHVTTPKSYDGAESYSARINDDYTYVIPSGCWYDFVKQDRGGGEMDWWLKDSGTFF